MYPAKNPPELKVVEFRKISYERRREAGRVLADAVRRLLSEQLLLLRVTNHLMKRSVGPAQGYFLLPEEEMNRIVRAVQELYGTKKEET